MSDTTMMKRALTIIGRGGCAKIFQGNCWDNCDRSPYAAYGADQWCDRCVAQAALLGKLPTPNDAPIGMELRGLSIELRAEDCVA